MSFWYFGDLTVKSTDSHNCSADLNVDLWFIPATVYKYYIRKIYKCFQGDHYLKIIPNCLLVEKKTKKQIHLDSCISAYL